MKTAIIVKNNKKIELLNEAKFTLDETLDSLTRKGIDSKLTESREILKNVTFPESFFKSK